MYKTSNIPANLQGITIPKPGTTQEQGKPILASNNKHYLYKGGKWYEVIPESPKK